MFFTVHGIKFENDNRLNGLYTLNDLLTDEIEEIVRFLNDTVKARKENEAAEIEYEIAQLQAKLAGLKGTTDKTRAPTIKYRNPNNPNEVYGGHGKRPQWFVDALAMVQGDEDATNRVLDELRVK